MAKKSLVIVIGFIILFSVLVLAQNKIEISTIKENFLVGENITFQVSLLDSANNPINADVSVIIEDAEKTTKIEKTVVSNNPNWEDVYLGDNANWGNWKITAKYGDDVTNPKIFSVEINEQVKFSLDGDLLSVTNIENTRYTKEIQIAIGSSIGVKSLNLERGETQSFRLIAPDGVYNIMITDGKTTFFKNEVSLTGKAVGVLDKDIKTDVSGITGVLDSADEENGGQQASKSNSFKNTFVYIFLIMVGGAAILLTIERIYRKKLEK